MTNPLFEKPNSLDTAKSISALVKLGLALSGNGTAVALGSFLETLLFTGLQNWKPQPADITTPDSNDSSLAVPQDNSQKASITEVLSFFNIRTIEIPQDSLLRLLRSDDWVSTAGGISLIAPEQTIDPPCWFSAQMLPEALHNSKLLLQMDPAGGHRLTTTFPAVRPPARAFQVMPDQPAEGLLEPRLQPSLPVTFTSIYRADTSQDLIEHGIRLSPGPPLPGFLVYFRFQTANGPHFHRQVLILDLSPSHEVAT